jgi:hypothetical protein
MADGGEKVVTSSCLRLIWNQEVDAVQVRAQGRPRKSLEKKSPNNTNDGTVFFEQPIRGNTAPYAMRRLKKGRPDLHARRSCDVTTFWLADGSAEVVTSFYRKVTWRLY